MPDLTPDDVARRWATGASLLDGDARKDRADLARQLLDAREALRGAIPFIEFWQGHNGAGEAHTRVRACLPEHRGDLIRALDDAIERRIAGSPSDSDSLAEAARRAGESMATLEEKRRYDMLTAATDEDLIGSIPHAPDGSALFRSDAAYTSQLHMIARALVAAAEACGKDDPDSREALCRHARELLRVGVEQGYVPPSETFAYFGAAGSGGGESAGAWHIEDMTEDQAKAVRARRAEHYTWRAIACWAHAEFGGKWWPESNQLVGQDICRHAAGMLGEDPESAPWN